MTMDPPRMLERPPPQTKFEFAERGWRIVFMWILVIFIGLPFVAFVAVLFFGFAYCFIDSVMNHRSMPNLTGGLENLVGPFAPYIAAGLGSLLGGYVLRQQQVNAQIRAGGGLGRPPFDGSRAPYLGPTSTALDNDTMINPHGGPNAP